MFFFRKKIKHKKLLVLVSVVFLVGGYLYYFKAQNPSRNNLNTKSIQQDGTQKGDFEKISQNLNIPWEVAFLPNGEILATERPGALVSIKSGKRIEIAGVKHFGEAGLLGMSLSPNFQTNNFIYLYLASDTSSGVKNRVERYRLIGDSLSDRRVMIDGINGSIFHDGGRIAFGPDNYLYITTGDAQNPNSAQDKNSLSGKILRINEDGSIPSDNPFGNAVYSYGHRNPQGLAWDDKGQLWATEHGRSGIQSGLDELNLIEKGKNYGWPVIQGDEKRDGMVTPIVNSGASTTWAPAGVVFYQGSIFFGGLRGEALYEYKINEKKLVTHLKNEYGRIRAVVLGPDNYLYITTSNTDGRGSASENDDKLIRINPKALN